MNQTDTAQFNTTEDPQRRRALQVTNARQSNTVAVIGVSILATSVLMCVWLFVAASHLPDTTDEFQQSTSEVPVQLRLLILGSVAIVLGVVALVLSIIGLILRNRPRRLAICGTIGAVMLLLGFFGVILTGVVLQSPL